MLPFSLWPVLLATLASIIIGSIWYGPLFGKRFMKETGMDTWSKERQAAEKKTMWVSYVGQLVSSFVLFAVVSGLFVGLGRSTVGGGLLLSFVLWIGIVVPVKLGDALWGGNKTLFWLNIGNMLVTLLVAGAIIGAWR